jgi:hypothetical protein
MKWTHQNELDEVVAGNFCCRARELPNVFFDDCVETGNAKLEIALVGISLEIARGYPKNSRGLTSGYLHKM